MNVLKITLSIASTFDLFSKTLAEIILRRRTRFYPDTPVVIFILSLPRMFRSFAPLRLMQSKNVCHPLFLLFELPCCPLRSASRRASWSGGQKRWRNFRRVSIRTWPIWHLEGIAARFPQIIILLSYNSFNSRESKTGEESNVGMSGSLYRTGRSASVCVML